MRPKTTPICILIITVLTLGLSACLRHRMLFLTPTPTTGEAMLTYLDIPYAQMEGVDPNLLSLDIYAPASGGSYPVMVMVHGGGWTTGDKASAEVAGTKSVYFTSQGYIFVSVNYRLSPQVVHPAHVQDVAASLAWIYAHIGDYQGDAERIFLMGHSAGAHLAALVATDEGYLAAHGLGLDILKGVILLDGAGYDIPYIMAHESRALTSLYEAPFGSDPEVWRDASPLFHVAAGKDIPPFLIFYAGQREASQVNGQKLSEALATAGVPSWLVAAPDKNHATLNSDIGKPGDGVTEKIMEFLEESAGGSK